MVSSLLVVGLLYGLLRTAEDASDEGGNLRRVNFDGYKPLFHDQRPNPILDISYHCPNTTLRDESGFCSRAERS